MSTPGGPTAVREFERVAEAVGERPEVVLSYADFTSHPPIDGLRAVERIGAMPFVTWEPWQWLSDGHYDTQRISLQSIIDGTHNDYIYWWADTLAQWGRPIYLRFAHEPNGTWYPWSPTAGTSPDTYVKAWRHVHRLFAEKNATNVRWVWTVNVSFPGSTPIAPLYPGDEYVDFVGLDGYNWGTSQPWSHWIEPADLFGATIDEARSIVGDKPFAITEVGCANVGGSKPEWIRDFLEFVSGQPELTAFIWFDHDKETDWRLASTPETAAAFAEQLGRRYR